MQVSLRLKRTFSVLSLIFLLSACVKQITPVATITPLPDITAQPTVTPSPLPPITGKLFFDMNGSGLQDESTFIYEPDRLNDPRQLLQPDLSIAIADFLASHPEIKKGDLISIREPNLSNYEICIEDECSISGLDGSFKIIHGKMNKLKINDPYADNPALAMRYINRWLDSKIIPPYEINGVKVPEQILNDTSLIALEDAIEVFSDEPNNIGLMQGFLTIPFGQDVEFIIGSWYDLDPQEQKVKNYYGESTFIKDFFPIRTKTEDQHHGIDFSFNEKVFVNSACNGNITNTSSIQRYDDGRTAELGLDVNHDNGYLSTYNHLDSFLLMKTNEVKRGQIIGIAGNSGSNPGLVKYGLIGMHFDLYNQIQAGAKRDESRVQVDPYRDITETISKWSSKYCSWTVDNLPQFALINKF